MGILMTDIKEVSVKFSEPHGYYEQSSHEQVWRGSIIRNIPIPVDVASGLTALEAGLKRSHVEMLELLHCWMEFVNDTLSDKYDTRDDLCRLAYAHMIAAGNKGIDAVGYGKSD
jgi:hypothetical protein